MSVCDPTIVHREREALAMADSLDTYRGWNELPYRCTFLSSLNLEGTWKSSSARHLTLGSQIQAGMSRSGIHTPEFICCIFPHWIVQSWTQHHSHWLLFRWEEKKGYSLTKTFFLESWVTAAPIWVSQPANPHCTLTLESTFGPGSYFSFLN